MTENEQSQTLPQSESKPPEAKVQLDAGTYEIIKSRLLSHGDELKTKLEALNRSRKETFGAIEMSLLATERISTANNCVPRDMAAIGNKFIFGYNVFFGLKAETQISDVFSVYEFKNNSFRELPLDIIGDQKFVTDFKDLYRYYKNTIFKKFAVINANLFMVFQVGRNVDDIKTFKWLIKDDGIVYLDNRSDHQYRLPAQHEFEWVRTHRDLHRFGVHPHISIDDRIFVETVGGDLTIKVEDNTQSGEGIYSEPVQDKDQTLDDAEIFYALIGSLIVLKILPYQEKDYRYIVYNEKIQKAVRIDSIANACVLLPDNQGVIFSRGYYLQSGEYKEFESNIRDMCFEKRIASPNGEDYLYVFHNTQDGAYVLFSYNIIQRKVETPLICGGYSLFDDGKLINFRGIDEPVKHHAIQIWQTPYVGQNFAVPAKRESLLYKIGNRDVVRCMAETREILSLIEKEDTFANLYIDLVKKSGDVSDAYFWLDKPEVFNIRETLVKIRETSATAVEEFEKVVRVKKNTREQIAKVSQRIRKIIDEIRADRFDVIYSYVASLSNLRGIRGEIIALRDLKYVDLSVVDSMEKENESHSSDIAEKCVEFLLNSASLNPYRDKAAAQEARIPELKTVATAKGTDKEIADAASELQMLIEIVSNLKIDDATKRTQIIDAISPIFSQLNQIRATVRKKIQEIAVVEGQAEFSSQVKLLGQSIINALDLCETPGKCDEQLTKIMVQIEELEGKFADFEQFVVALAEKRQEAYAAFESKKLILVEARSKRANGLMTAADRILKGIAAKLSGFKTVNEIHGYFASDLMIDKVRNIVKQLVDIGDTVKADELQSRLKTLREEGVRQLKDRQDLFLDGENVIKLGTHHFSVNRQALDLTYVLRNRDMFFYLTGTNFFEKISDPEFLGYNDLWLQEIVSENQEIYRGEYLAYMVFKSLEAGKNAALAGVAKLGLPELLKVVQAQMGPRYSEGYVKGVHDQDAAAILKALLELHSGIGLLRYSSSARAMAAFFWGRLGESSFKTLLEAKIQGIGTIAKIFPDAGALSEFKEDLISRLTGFVRDTRLFPQELVDEAADYLFHVLSHRMQFVVSREAAEVYQALNKLLDDKGMALEFQNSINKVRGDPPAVFSLLRSWVDAYADARKIPNGWLVRDEVALLLFEGACDAKCVSSQAVTRDITGMIGSHSLIEKSRYHLNYNIFMTKIARYMKNVVPRYESFIALKKSLLERKKEELRLDQFKARVFSAFVRNQLIDQVYLPLIGNNLAKQMGVVGEEKQPDRMGLLLLISPPGYGKTTLMEYVANRLGVIFIKINGPSIGRKVTSIDPAEAPNAAAREEIEKLNLALEMGDNIMIYIDDIQHCSTEFLEKFISLCDAQRKIEGVFKGKTKTYDLRGKKVAVVMAGNPYTESGEKFSIPDMLANRADTYNLGDIIGGKVEAFHLSYIENAMASNSALAKLASKNAKDVYSIVKAAQTNSLEGLDTEGTYSAEEVNEFVATMKKLLRVREVILKVNREYIASAAQAEAYRVEPPFKLQGSYRNMNRIAEKVLPIMNDDEIERLIRDHYENEAQTLAMGAESNLLKFRELLGVLSETEKARLDDIRKTFKKNQMLRGIGSDDRMGQLMAQLSYFGTNLEAIKDVLATGLTQEKGAPGKRKT